MPAPTREAMEVLAAQVESWAAEIEVPPLPTTGGGFPGKPFTNMRTPAQAAEAARLEARRSALLEAVRLIRESLPAI